MNHVQKNEGYIRINNELKPIFFREWARGTPSRTLICTHGSGGNSADFGPFANMLLQRKDCEGLRIIAYDCPGQGFSLANIKGAEVLLRVKLLMGIIRTEKSPCVVMSMSGGSISTILALHQLRDLSHVPVILNEPTIGISQTALDHIAAAQPFWETPFRSVESAEAKWDQTALAQMQFAEHYQKKEFIRGRLIPNGEGFMHATQKVVNPKAPNSTTILDEKSPFENPCLLLWGEHSSFVAEGEERLKASFPKANSHHLKGRGHPLSLTFDDELDLVSEHIGRHLQ